MHRSVPDAVGSTATAPEDDQASADADLTRIQCGDHAIDEPIRARLHGLPIALERGSRLRIVIDVAPTHLFLNEGQFAALAAVARTGVTVSGKAVETTVVARGSGIRAWIDRARARVRARIEATFHPGATPLARALVLGENDLPDDDADAFKVSGLSHLLAVSGTHLVLAVLSLTAALHALLVRVQWFAAGRDPGRWSSACAIPAAWLYADFAGGSGSAVRAAAMLTAAMLARAIGRRPSTARAFAWAVLGGAAFDPLLVCDLSFGLSAAATAGLLVLDPPLRRILVRGPPWARKPLAPLSATLSAMAACAPWILLVSPTFPVLGVLANVVAAPIGELAALPVCLAHACLGWIPIAEKGAAIVGSGALLAVRSVAHAGGTGAGALRLPPPTGPELAWLVVGIVGCWCARGLRARILLVVGVALGMGLLEVQARRAGAPHGVLRVTMLDVGQGDSAIVDLPDGSAMLIDGGGFVGSPVDPGKRVILPVLRERRRTRIDVVVLSHPHPDHFGGLVSTLRELDVGEFWDTGQGEEQGAGSSYAALLAEARSRGVVVKRPNEVCGRSRSLGGAEIDVLAPCPRFEPDAGANDNSFVLRVRFGARSALFVGDAEHDEETKLLAASRDALRADFLKVGHHGSRTSTGRNFVAAVAPAIAGISCGVRNRFGHPHPRTMRTLVEMGLPVVRTDRGGEIIWRTDGSLHAIVRPALFGMHVAGDCRQDEKASSHSR